MAPALGGTPEEWGRANAATFPGVLKQVRQIAGPTEDPRIVFDIEYLLLVQAMCDWLSVPRPSDAECVRLGREYSVRVRRDGQAVFPAASELVHTLAQRHDLHMATGNPSWVAEALLDGMGVRESIGFPCGPDLISVWKGSDAFHATLFEAVGVAPGDALVVDDLPEQVANARAAGASTVLVTSDQVGADVADAVVSDLSEIAAAVLAIDQQRQG